MLFLGFGMENGTAKAVHPGLGTQKIQAQHIGRHLAHRAHAKGLCRLVEQKPAGPQQHAAVVAALRT